MRLRVFIQLAAVVLLIAAGSLTGCQTSPDEMTYDEDRTLRMVPGERTAIRFAGRRVRVELGNEGDVPVELTVMTAEDREERTLKPGKKWREKFSDRGMVILFNDSDVDALVEAKLRDLRVADLQRRTPPVEPGAPRTGPQ